MFKFPAITVFNDYHEIENFEANLNDLFNLKGENRIKSIEINANKNNLSKCVYYGLFYVGRKPSNEEIVNIIKNKYNKNYTINNVDILNN